MPIAKQLFHSSLVTVASGRIRLIFCLKKNIALLLSQPLKHGLIDKNGKIITKPLYIAIDAIGKDVFMCDLDHGGAKVTINSKGDVVNEKRNSIHRFIGDAAVCPRKLK